MKLIDRKGEKYGRLVVVDRALNKSATDTNARWLCKCECGKHCVVYGQDLKRGKQVSCGCWNTEKRTSHGMSRTHVNSVWRQMRDRCNNPKNPSYKNYGGRGIEVCDRWSKFENFIADMGDRPGGYTLDRIDNSKGYSPDNCRWATMMQQLNNRRNNRYIEWNGESKTLAEWSRTTGVSWFTLRARIDRLGWTIDRALSTVSKSKIP